jgi:zinc finger protein-like protein
VQLVACEAAGTACEANAEAARLQQRTSLVSRLRQKMASARASLDTHMRAEEANIWPLFSEHFTVEEQSALVGAVIGRTGADVLQALIPWVMGSVSESEKIAMFDSLRQAAANTHFNEWMDKMVPADILKAEEDMGRVSEHGLRALEAGEAQPGVWPESKAVADVTAYQPGWADIFRMNATQLEAAAAAAPGGSDAGDLCRERDLRRSYLTHNLLVSCFLVAQQQRMGQAESAPPEAASHVTNEGIHGGCKHYKAGCVLIAPCCGAEVTCRLCHDEAGVCGTAFDRYAVREMRCSLCNMRQPVAQRCNHCKASMARYYCSICHLFDDDPSAPHKSVVAYVYALAAVA